MIQRIEPQEGQESVWDYPRPPKVDPTNKPIKVVFNGEVIADTTRAIRVLETSHPPTIYIPREDIKMEYFAQTGRHTFCEFKGMADYWRLDVNGKIVENAAWCYENPYEGYADIKGYLSFYPSKMDSCTINGEVVQAQEGHFYGGWVTSEIVGPFKGAPGTFGW